MIKRSDIDKAMLSLREEVENRPRETGPRSPTPAVVTSTKALVTPGGFQPRAGEGVSPSGIPVEVTGAVNGQPALGIASFIAPYAPLE